MGEPNREAGQWVLQQEIGSGSFAKVWQATHKQTQQVAAVKEINLDKLSKKLQESLASEVAVLKHTQHHNIVCLLDLIKDANRLYLVLEFCAGGDLGHYLRRYRQVSEATARYFLQHVAEGLKELRRHNVVHRDLKPQNLLLSDSTSAPLLKIADFGFARSLAPQGLAETLCGSPLYMAPEILQFQKYDAKADLWSVGTILYELLVGKPPYNGANHIQLLRNIEAAEARLPDHIAARLSPACRGLLGRLLQRNPVERISFEEFFSHPFLAGEGHQGPCPGIPPPQPLQPTAGAALPAAMRQAAAAAAAAAAADARAQRAVGSSVTKPQLHVGGSLMHRQQEAAGAGLTGTQQQQQQHALPPVPPQQQQPQQQRHHQQQQQQQHMAGLVSQPVSHHPLAPEAPQHAGGDEGLSDSMEGDFVVVHTPHSSSTPHTRSTSNSSSKASSGLADPKAAAVLQGMPHMQLGQAPGGPSPSQARRGWPDAAQGTGLMLPYFQRQQQQHLLPGVTAAPQQQQQQHLSHQQGVSNMPHQHLQGLVQVSASPQAGQFCSPSQAVLSVSVMQRYSLQLPATPLQRVQLLVQVVRGCVGLLSAADSSNAGPRDAAGRPSGPLHESEQLALLLLALQVVQLLCCPAPAGKDPQRQQQQREQERCGVGDAADQEDLAAVLASASQSDVEQLMTAVVDLIHLAHAATKALTDQHHSPPAAMAQHHSNMPASSAYHQQQQAAGSCWGAAEVANGAGAAAEPTAAAAAAAAASGMVSSLMQVPLPDPAGVLYHAALDSAKAAAVEEVMGNWRSALEGYSLAADLLLFLSQSWPELPAPAAPGLGAEDQALLNRLYAAVNNRLMAVVAEAPPADLAC